MFALFSKIQLCTQTRGWKCSGSRGDRSSTHTFPGRRQGQGKHCFVGTNIAQSHPGGGCCYLATSKSVGNLLETLWGLGSLPTVLLDAKTRLAVISQARDGAGWSPSLTFIRAGTTHAVVLRARTETKLDLTKKVWFKHRSPLPNIVFCLAHNSGTRRCAHVPEGSCWECVCGNNRYH